jgi:hypothetical protein
MMRRKRDKEKEWHQVEGETQGVMYSEDAGYVWVRVPEGDWFREIGPARLIGESLAATVRQLLREARNSN